MNDSPVGRNESMLNLSAAHTKCHSHAKRNVQIYKVYLLFQKAYDLLSPLSLPSISTKRNDYKNVYCVILKHGNEVVVNQGLTIYIDTLNIYRLQCRYNLTRMSSTRM